MAIQTPVRTIPDPLPAYRARAGVRCWKCGTRSAVNPCDPCAAELIAEPKTVGLARVESRRGTSHTREVAPLRRLRAALKSIDALTSIILAEGYRPDLTLRHGDSWTASAHPIGSRPTAENTLQVHGPEGRITTAAGAKVLHELLGKIRARKAGRSC